MTIPENIFREYDIRGEADKELNDEVINLIGKAYGSWLIRSEVNTPVTVGGDARLSTPRIKSALINGILSAGLDVIDIGLVTTPMLYWSLINFNLQGGAMITGSHNPSNMNGLKLCFGHGTLWGQDIQNIKAIAEGKNFEQGSGNLSSSNINEAYLKCLCQNSISPSAKNLKSSVIQATEQQARQLKNFLKCWAVNVFHFMTNRTDISLTIIQTLKNAKTFKT